jgi:radical SAM-linked protein
MIYRPVRERSPQTLMYLARRSLAATGFEDMSLLSLSSGDYGCIVPLLEGLMASHAGDHVAISLPSLRAGTLTPELMSLIKRVRKTGFTIAPEAGSQRLRDVINKNIGEAEILAAVENAFELGWRAIKLYFMIGLPTETEADLKEMVDLVKRLRRTKGRRGQINVSVATFIPKPHTPFQWAPQMSLDESEAKIRWLRRQLKLPGVKFKWQNPQVSLIEGIFARGDRRLATLLEAAYDRGCRFDGWSDQFELERWQQAFEQVGTDPSFYTTRVRDLCEPLPWDHLDLRVSKDYLRDEWHRALGSESSVDCRDGDCLQCGSCDFQQIEPRTHRHFEPTSEKRATGNPPPRFRKMHLRYSKTGPAKYFGHLELKNIIIRAFKRAGIPLRYSEGFHPQPKVSFQDALPIGLESESEDMVLQVATGMDAGLIANRLNDQLPAGIEILDCRPATAKVLRPPTAATIRYEIILADGAFEPAELDAFMGHPNPTITISRPKGRLKKIEIKDILVDISLPGPNQLYLTLASVPGKTLRPAELIAFVFSLPEEQLKQARIVKKQA